jgi:hypothetical protein
VARSAAGLGAKGLLSGPASLAAHTRVNEKDSTVVGSLPGDSMSWVARRDPYRSWSARESVHRRRRGGSVTD